MSRLVRGPRVTQRTLPRQFLEHAMMGLHPWNVDAQEAVRLQERLRESEPDAVAAALPEGRR